MASHQEISSFPPEAQALIAALLRSLNERDQHASHLQQALNESRQQAAHLEAQVFQRDLQITQLQTQVTQLTQLQGAVAQVEKIHDEMTELRKVATENHGMIKEIWELEMFVPSEEVIESEQAGIPAELWTHVFGFLPYSDVCRMTRVARIFRSQVMDTLKTIYIDNERALVHSRRYDGDNVQEIVFDCFFQDFSDPVGDVPGSFTLKSWFQSNSSINLSFFVNRFKKLKYIFIGKGNGETKQEILCRLSLQGSLSTGYDYVSHISRHINFVMPPPGDGHSMLTIHNITRSLYDPMRHPNRMVFGLPRLHRGQSCLTCTYEGVDIPRIESKAHPGMFLPC